MSRPDARYRTFISYIDKSREYYQAQGYPKPFRWSYNEDAPFTPLSKPLAESRLGVVTTAFPFRDDRPDVWVGGKSKQAFGLAVAEVPDRMYTEDLAWDKDATHTDDLGSFLPLAQVDRLVDEGRLGSASSRFYGAPTDYSHRRTSTVDAPAILDMMVEDEVDVALLAPI